jgi:hypothetical protein
MGWLVGEEVEEGGREGKRARITKREAGGNEK